MITDANSYLQVKQEKHSSSMIFFSCLRLLVTVSFFNKLAVFHTIRCKPKL